MLLELSQSHLAKVQRIAKETPEKEKAAEELPLATHNTS